MIFEHFEGGQHDFRAIGNDFAPGLAAWIADGRSYQAERAATGIRAKEENLFAESWQGTGMMVRVILVIVLAPGNQLKWSERVICAEKADLAGSVACRSKQKVCATSRAFDFNMKALVCFFVEQRVRIGGPKNMAIEAVGAFGRFVFDGIEERLVISGPGNAGNALNTQGKHLRGTKVFHMKSVLAESSGIRGIGEQLIVVTDVECA